MISRFAKGTSFSEPEERDEEVMLLNGLCRVQKCGRGHAFALRGLRGEGREGAKAWDCEVCVPGGGKKGHEVAIMVVDCRVQYSVTAGGWIRDVEMRVVMLRKFRV